MIPGPFGPVAIGEIWGFKIWDLTEVNKPQISALFPHRSALFNATVKIWGVEPWGQIWNLTDSLSGVAGANKSYVL